MNTSLQHLASTPLVELWLMGMHNPNTVRAYRKDIEDFCKFAQVPSTALHELPEMTTFQLATGYVQSLKGQSTATVARRLSSVRSYYEYLCGLGLRARNPLDHVRVEKIQHKKKDPLTREDVNAILSKAQGRDLCILIMLAHLGLRREEVAKLKNRDINTAGGRTILTVVVKGGDEESLPLTQALADAIKEYQTGKALDPNAALFPNDRGGHPSGQSIYNLVQKYERLAGVDKEITPHSFRHFVVDDSLESGMDAVTICSLTNHKSAATVQRYSNLDKLRTVERIQTARGLK